MALTDRFIVGNWKMNGSYDLVQDMVAALKTSPPPSGAEVVLCPPYPYLSEAVKQKGNSPLHIGAQDCAPQKSGAFTGDVSAEMLKDIGVSMVILGHSERRHNHTESSQLIAQKVEMVQAENLTAIICIGETKAEKDRDKTIEVLKAQVDQSLPPSTIVEKTIVAYEPVWAIGTGITPTPDEANAIHKIIHEYLYEKFHTYTPIPLLYGGSVNPGNALEFMEHPFINGVLVGGASLNKDDFLQIIGV